MEKDKASKALQLPQGTCGKKKKKKKQQQGKNSDANKYTDMFICIFPESSKAKRRVIYVTVFLIQNHGSNFEYFR